MSDFKSEYQKLNEKQKLAVDTIEGPVMVIAGAGTGKTQTIALRIANILAKTQTNPSSILCLTFTDTGVTAMRDRLIKIIGPTAYSVRLHTFHSFCNDIILSHPENFIISHNLKPADELEKLEITNELIDKLPDGSVLKPWGDHYFYRKDIISSIQTLKRENISSENLKTLITNQQNYLSTTTSQYESLKKLRVGKTIDIDIQKIVDSLPPNSQISYHYNLYKNGGYNIGAAKNSTINFKNALIKFFDNLIKNIPKQLELLVIFQGYQLALQTQGMYDFDDMILFVIDAFKNDSNLLRTYQEQYQYFLVDEYQDTNSAQNQILDLLSDYYDNPNIFVVGDDDQSIFRFQGASIENVYDFYLKYKTTPIVLQNNYRSHQLILDSSTSVINNNQNRIANFIKDIDKSLKSNSSFDPDPINVISANSTLEENFWVSEKIKKLIETGVNPNEIAVLYRNNNDISDLAQALKQEKINFYLNSDQNILNSRHIQQLIYLLKFINDPTQTDLFYHILASDYVNFNSLDLLKKVRHIDDLSSNSKIKLRNIDRRLALARKWLENDNLDRFFNKVIRKFKFLDYCLSQKDPQILNHLLTFHQELKRLSVDKKYTLKQFLDRLDSLIENNLIISAPPLVQNLNNSVQLLTVHRAKGLEFEHVFLIKVADKKWGNTRNMSKLSLPLGILKYDIANESSSQNEDERRLFYVALTRAKKQIYISYSGIPSVFVSEIDPKLIETINIPADTQTIALQQYFPLVENQNIDISYQNYLTEFLKTKYLFNVTHLNSYLRCPFCFYHQTILRIPAVKDKFSSLGTAVHNTLSHYYNHQTISLSELQNIFKDFLLKENLNNSDYNESLFRGTNIMTDYFNQYGNVLSKNNKTDYDFKSANLHLNNIPITGKIDLIEYLDGNKINVVDFKTGNPDGKYKELSPEGDYFRQLAFYKLLISLDSTNMPWHVPSTNIFGIIDFVQKSKQKNTLIRKEIKITPDDVEALKLLITDVYTKILALDFFKIRPDCKDHQHIHYLLNSR
ncbi:MAG: ATP-dependent DNA helicase [Candidatus Shapirobacteria bacterium]